MLPDFLEKFRKDQEQLATVERYQSVQQEEADENEESVHALEQAEQASEDMWRDIAATRAANRATREGALRDSAPGFWENIPQGTEEVVVMREEQDRQKNLSRMLSWNEDKIATYFNSTRSQDAERARQTAQAAKDMVEGTRTVTGQHTPKARWLQGLHAMAPDRRERFLNKWDLNWDELSRLTPADQMEAWNRAVDVKSSPFMRGIDVISRPLFAVTGFVDGTLTNAHDGPLMSVLHGLNQAKSEVFTPHRRAYGADVIRKISPAFAREHPYWTTGVGLGIDILFDPITYITLGTSAAGTIISGGTARRIGGRFHNLRPSVIREGTQTRMGVGMLGQDLTAPGLGRIGPGKATGDDLIDTYVKTGRVEEAEAAIGRAVHEESFSAGRGSAKQKNVKGLKGETPQLGAEITESTPIVGEVHPGGMTLTKDAGETVVTEVTHKVPAQEFTPTEILGGKATAEAPLARGPQLQLTKAGEKRFSAEVTTHPDRLWGKISIAGGESLYPTRQAEQMILNRAQQLLDEGTIGRHIETLEDGTKQIVEASNKFSRQEAVKMAVDELEAAANAGDNAFGALVERGLFTQAPEHMTARLQASFLNSLRDPVNFRALVDDRLISFAGSKVVGKRGMLSMVEKAEEISKATAGKVKVIGGRLGGKLTDIGHYIDKGVSKASKIPVIADRGTDVRDIGKRLISWANKSSASDAPFSDWFARKFLNNSGALGVLLDTTQSGRVGASVREALNKWGDIPQDLRERIRGFEGAAAGLVDDGTKLAKKLFDHHTVEELESLGEAMRRVSAMDSMNEYVEFGGKRQRFHSFTPEDQQAIVMQVKKELIGPQIHPVTGEVNVQYAEWTALDTWYRRIRTEEMRHGLVVDELTNYSPMYWNLTDKPDDMMGMYERFRHRASMPNYATNTEAARSVQYAEAAAGSRAPITNAVELMISRTLHAAEGIKRSAYDLNDAMVFMAYADPEAIAAAMTKATRLEEVSRVDILNAMGRGTREVTKREVFDPAVFRAEVKRAVKETRDTKSSLGLTMDAIIKADSFNKEGLYGARARHTVTGLYALRALDKLVGMFRYGATQLNPAFAIKQIPGNASQLALEGGSSIITDGFKRVANLFKGPNGKPRVDLAPSLADVGTAFRVFKQEMVRPISYTGKMSNVMGHSDEAVEHAASLVREAEEITKLRQKVAFVVNDEKVTWGKLWQEITEGHIMRGVSVSTGFTSVNVSRESRLVAKELEKNYRKGTLRAKAGVATKPLKAVEHGVGRLVDGIPVNRTLRENMKFLAGHAVDYTAMPSSMEDFFRVLGYVQMRRHGINPKLIPKRIDNAFFDYGGGLSKMEERVARRLIPFYSYDRFAIELIGRSILKRPGAVANVQKASNSIYKAYGHFLAELKGQPTDEPLTDQERWVTPEFVLERPSAAAGYWKNMETTFKVFPSMNVLETVRGANYEKFDRSVGDEGLLVQELFRSTASSVWQRITPLVKIPIDLAVNYPVRDVAGNPDRVLGPFYVGSGRGGLETLGAPLFKDPTVPRHKSGQVVAKDAQNFDEDAFLGAIAAEVLVSIRAMMNKHGYTSVLTAGVIAGTDLALGDDIHNESGDLLVHLSQMDEGQLRAAVKYLSGVETVYNPDTGLNQVMISPLKWYTMGILFPSVRRFSNIAHEKGGDKHPVDAVTDFLIGTSTINVDLNEQGDRMYKQNLTAQSQAQRLAALSYQTEDYAGYDDARLQMMSIMDKLAFEMELRMQPGMQDNLRGQYMSGVTEQLQRYQIPEQVHINPPSPSIEKLLEDQKRRQR
jgi:hypothetical protein